MSPLLLAFVGAALATDPTTPAELGDAELEAVGMIASCRYGRCPYDERQLAEAFLIRATAEAVLRGRIDTTAAANARFLAPELAAGWGDLLPGSDRGEPEGWVRDWAGSSPPAAPAPPAPVLAPAPPARELHRPRPPRAPSEPMALRADAPTVARIALALRPDSGIGGEAQADLRAQLNPEMGVLVGATVGYQQSRWGADMTETLGTDVSVIASRAASLRLGAGPRWSRPSGEEVFVHASVRAEMSALTWRTWTGLAEDGVVVDPGPRGLAGAIGVISVHPLPVASLALHLDGGAEWGKRATRARYFDGRRNWAGTNPDLADREYRDTSSRDLLSGRLTADLRWQPGEASPVTVSAGVSAVAEQWVGRSLSALPARGPDLHLEPRLGAGWAF